MVIQMKHTMVIDGEDFLHFLKYIFLTTKKRKIATIKEKKLVFYDGLIFYIIYTYYHHYLVNLNI